MIDGVLMRRVRECEVRDRPRSIAQGKGVLGSEFRSKTGVTFTISKKSTSDGELDYNICPTALMVLAGQI